MERLKQSELKSLHDFVRDCHTVREFESFDDFLKRVVASCVRLIPATHVTYNEMDLQKSESHNCVSKAEFATPQAERLWEQHMNEHPVLKHVQRMGSCGAMRISDLWSQRRLRDSGLYSDFYRHYEIADAMCIAVCCPRPRIIGVGWHDDRIFTDRERLMADLVRPHISQAWHNARLFGRIRNKLTALETGMEKLETGVILCGADERVQFINPQARRYLAEYFGVTKQTGRRLPLELQDWARQQDAQSRTRDEAPPVRTPLVRKKKNNRLVVRVFSQPEAKFFLMEERPVLPGTNSLAAFGLTVREVQVLNWIARGKANSEIAIILRMSTGTVKKHIEHIFKKLGVENRTAAASMALAANPVEAID